MLSRIKKQKDAIANKSSDITKLLQKKEKLAKTNNDLELSIKELEYKIKELQTEAADCQNRVR